MLPGVDPVLETTSLSTKGAYASGHSTVGVGKPAVDITGTLPTWGTLSPQIS